MVLVFLLSLWCPNCLCFADFVLASCGPESMGGHAVASILAAEPVFHFLHVRINLGMLTVTIFAVQFISLLLMVLFLFSMLLTGGRFFPLWQPAHA